MSDIRCPYCKADQYIDHGDGFGCEEDQDHEQLCRKCGKKFKFQTSISYVYNVQCFNPSDHELEAFEEPNEHGQFYFCKKCEWDGYIKEGKTL